MDIKTQKELTRAKKIAKKGEIKEAKKIFEKIIKDSPHDPTSKLTQLLYLLSIVR